MKLQCKSESYIQIMSHDYLNLINTNRNLLKDVPSSASLESSTYQDVLTRIYNQMEQESRYLPSVPFDQYLTSTNQPFTKDLQKNHQVLKQMIDLIDNRQTSRKGDSLSFDRSRSKERRNRLMNSHEESREEGKYKRKGSNTKDLVEVKQHLKKAIEIIDKTISERQEDNKSDSQSMKPSDYQNLRQAIGDHFSKLNHENAKPGKNDVLRVTSGEIKTSQHPPQGKSNQINSSASTHLPTNWQHSNIKPPLDLRNEHQMRYNTIQSYKVDENQGGEKKRVFFSQPKQVNLNAANNHGIPRDGRLLSPRINAINQPTQHNTSIPVSIRPSSLDQRVFQQKGKQLSAKITFNKGLERVPYIQIPQTMNFRNHYSPVIYENQPKMVSEQSNNSNSVLYDSNATLKKSSKTKQKFSFRNPIEDKQPKSPETLNFRQFGETPQTPCFNFPKPYTQENSPQDNPFDSWFDKSEEEMRVQTNQQGNLTSIAEHPEFLEDNVKQSIIHQMQGFENSPFKPQQSKRVSIFGEPMKAGSGLKKKGICLCQPIYQTQFYPIN